MTASVLLESRATTGLRRPRSVGRNVWPARGGLAVHWAGEHQNIDTGTPHARCRVRLQAWQNFHMDDRGWADLAYNWVICQHAVVMVGRGWGVRSAANGTDDGNDRYLAVCWMGGEHDGAPTPGALHAFEWLIGEVRRRGAGRDVEPHRHFFGTECPGGVLTAMTSIWRKAPVDPGIPPFPLPTGWYFGPADGPEESVSGYYSHRSDLARWQARRGMHGDGLYGPLTAAEARRVQTHMHIRRDGLIGPLTWKAAWSQA